MSDQPHIPAAPPPDSEVTVLDIWRTVLRRKIVIGAWTAFCIAVGAAFAFLSPPVYEASVKLSIGQLPVASGLSPLESAEDISSRALAQFGEDVAQGIKRERPFLKRAAAQKSADWILDLTAEGDTPDEAAILLTRVVESIQATHNATFQRNIQLLNERLTNMEVERQAVKQQLHHAGLLLEQLKQQNAVQASIFIVEVSRISTFLSELESEKTALAQRLAPPQTRPTELLGEIIAPAKPASPKKAMALILSAALGLIGGVMLAFFADFVAKARRTDSEEIAKAPVRSIPSQASSPS